MNDQAYGDDGVIELRLQEVNQLFDAWDPAPYRKKELSHAVEQYLVESVKELPSGNVQEIVLYVAHAQPVADAAAITVSIHAHFARRSKYLQRALRQLLRRGFVSLLIGLSFLTLMFLLSQCLAGMMDKYTIAKILREGLLIIGWVAMWKPLEILLYDWWPLLSERRLFGRLSQVPVCLVAEKAS